MSSDTIASIVLVQRQVRNIKLSVAHHTTPDDKYSIVTLKYGGHSIMLTAEANVNIEVIDDR